MKRSFGAVVVVIGAFMLLSDPAAAHPLGNFTVNTYSGLVVRPRSVEIRFVLDMAEIPSFQRKAEIDTDGDGRTSATETNAFRIAACNEIRRNVDLRLRGRSLVLAVVSNALSFPPGQAGLTTLRLTCTLNAEADLTTGGDVTYATANYIDRTGWREITAVGDGVTLGGVDLRSSTISNELTTYPKDLLQAPLDERKVAFTATPGGPRLADGAPGAGGPVAPLPRGVDKATKAFTSFVARQHLTFNFALAAIALSVLLGAVHAFAPGHGKTVMAAYLVGQEGSMRQAGLIALTVTLTHTAGVLVLGVAISASAIVAPERLYPYLGLASGIMLAGIGVGLVTRPWRLRRRLADSHHHADGHDVGHRHGSDHDPHHHVPPQEVGVTDPAGLHSHGGASHSHGAVRSGQPMTWGSMLAIGFVGGFLPSPSAVVVILGAIALHRAWFGVVLVLGYGVGMALTLTGAGLLLLKTRGALNRRYFTSGGDRLAALNRLLPTLTGAVIVVVGLVLAGQGLSRV